MDESHPTLGKVDFWSARLHAQRMSKRAEYTVTLYSGSVAEPGDRNPYNNGRSLVLAKLWRRGYMRMLRAGIDTGPAMQRYRAACAAAESRST